MKKKHLQLLLLAAVIIIGALSFRNIDSTDDAADDTPTPGLLRVRGNDHLPARNLRYTGMDISFNPELHIPNYVAWELTAAEAIGKEPRYNIFVADPRVPESATPDDYRLSGFDRGHMAPAGDMKWDAQAMRESFMMTNIAPQAKKLNTGSWRSLEEKCRQWAQTDRAIVIICGPVPGEPPTQYIGATGVAVPQRFFKVILSPYGDTPRAIGFVMNNGDNPGGMQRCAMSVDEVEALTGYDFFSALDDETEDSVEAQCNFDQWSRRRR